MADNDKIPFLLSWPLPVRTFLWYMMYLGRGLWPVALAVPTVIFLRRANATRRFWWLFIFGTVPPLAFFSVFGNKYPDYVLPMLPLFLIAILLGLHRAPRALRWSLLVPILALSLANPVRVVARTPAVHFEKFGEALAPAYATASDAEPWAVFWTACKSDITMLFHIRYNGCGVTNLLPVLARRGDTLFYDAEVDRARTQAIVWEHFDKKPMLVRGATWPFSLEEILGAIGQRHCSFTVEASDQGGGYRIFFHGEEVTDNFSISSQTDFGGWPLVVFTRRDQQQGDPAGQPGNGGMRRSTTEPQTRSKRLSSSKSRIDPSCFLGGTAVKAPRPANWFASAVGR